MKVFALRPRVSYSGGCTLIVAPSIERAWELVENDDDIAYEGRDCFTMGEVKGLTGENEGVVIRSIYIE